MVKLTKEILFPNASEDYQYPNNQECINIIKEVLAGTKVPNFLESVMVFHCHRFEHVFWSAFVYANKKPTKQFKRELQNIIKVFDTEQ